MRLVAVLLLSALAAGTPDQWPQFRGNPALSGVAAAALEVYRCAW